MYQNTDESLRLINDYESKKRKGKKKNCSLYEYERNFYKIGVAVACWTVLGKISQPIFRKDIWMSL